MKTATNRAMVWIPTGLATLVAVVALQAGCDAQHFLGTVDAGTRGAGGTVARGSGGAGATGSVDASAAGGTTSIGGGAGGGTPRDASGTIMTDAGPSGPDVGVLGASQSWTGYVENYQFPSGSDLINITFASDAAGNMVGTITLGTGTPPPPATDPNVGYPATVEAMLANGGGTGLVGYVAEGFAYPLVNGTLTTNRMRFDVNRYDLWQSWCALETPAVDGSGRCTPNWESESTGSTEDVVCNFINPANGQLVPIDCGKQIICGIGTCACGTNSCAPGQNDEPLSFDLSITNERADGSVLGLLDSLGSAGEQNVHIIQAAQDR
jgi:hypothetical protein